MLVTSYVREVITLEKPIKWGNASFKICGVVSERGLQCGRS